MRSLALTAGEARHGDHIAEAPQLSVAPSTAIPFPGAVQVIATRVKSAAFAGEFSPTPVDGSRIVNISLRGLIDADPRGAGEITAMGLLAEGWLTADSDGGEIVYHLPAPIEWLHFQLPSLILDDLEED
jgi:hypothetical protein